MTYATDFQSQVGSKAQVLSRLNVIDFSDSSLVLHLAPLLWPKLQSSSQGGGRVCAPTSFPGPSDPFLPYNKCKLHKPEIENCVPVNHLPVPHMTDHVIKNADTRDPVGRLDQEQRRKQTSSAIYQGLMNQHEPDNW